MTHLSHNKKFTKTAGFTLLELMTTVAIVAIIAAIAIPSYIDYTKKSRYSELVRATAPFKLGVVHCFNTMGSFDECNAGNNGIPAAITLPHNKESIINKISVVKGVITAEPNPIHGIHPDEAYILTPSATNGLVSWEASGKGVSDGLTN